MQISIQMHLCEIMVIVWYIDLCECFPPRYYKIMDPMVTQMQVPPFLRDVWVIFVYINHLYVAQHPCIHANTLVFWFVWTFLTEYL